MSIYNLTSIIFYIRATDGKIVNAQAMEVYYDVMEVYKVAGIVSEEEIEDLKSFDATFQVQLRFRFLQL